MRIFESIENGLVPYEYRDGVLDVGDLMIISEKQNGEYSGVWRRTKKWIDEEDTSWSDYWKKSEYTRKIKDTKIARKVHPQFKEYKKGWILV